MLGKLTLCCVLVLAFGLGALDGVPVLAGSSLPDTPSGPLSDAAAAAGASGVLECGDVVAADAFTRFVPPDGTWGDPEVGVGPWEISFGGAGMNLWSVANGVGKASTTASASSGQRVRGSRDVDVRVRFALTDTARGGRVSTGLFARYRTHGGPSGDYVRMRVRHGESGRLSVSLTRIVGGASTTTREVDAGPVRKRRWYWMRLEVVGDRARAKVWARRAAEPRWQASMSDASIGRMPETDMGIRNSYASGSMLPQILFDEFTARVACP